MSGFNRVGFFFVILVFAGSLVLIAAQDLRVQHLQQKKSLDSAAMQNLINSLHGDSISNLWRDPEVTMEAKGIPQRRPGDILSEPDREGIKFVIG